MTLDKLTIRGPQGRVDLADTETLSILIVDDRPTNLASMKQLLARPGLDILTAESGNEALGLMLDHDLALVLLDVQMPGMDGIEVADLMRRNDHTRSIPIIFVTAINKERRHIFSGYEAGAVDYMFKPVDPAIMRAKVEVFLEMKRGQLAQARLVTELNEANARLQEISCRKSDYLSAASHELRTPLTVIKEFCSLVYDEVPGPLNDEQKSCMEAANRNVRRLADLVNDLLDLDSIESGHSHIRRAKVDLACLLDTCHSDFSVKCGGYQQVLTLDAGRGLPDVLGDAGMLTQVLVNLLGNAHKFTPEGGRITLRARQRENLVKVEIRDNGPGLSEEDQTHIFDKFTQVNRRNGPGPKGTGLGLAITRKIIQLHGGEIGVVSRPGQGACFHFTVPVFTADRHLQAFVADGTNHGPVASQDWSLVLMRTIQGGPLPKGLSKEADRVIRRTGDICEELEIDGQSVQALLLQTDRVGAMSVLSRLEAGLTARRTDPAQLEYALLSVPRGQREVFRLEDQSLPYVPLSLTEPVGDPSSEKGVTHVPR